MSDSPAPELEPADLPDPGEPYLLLDAGGRRLGISLPEVLEVVPPRACTRLPGSTSAVLGVFNLRGRVVTVVDVACTLGLAETPAAAGRVVVVEHRGKRVGLAVDDAARILLIDPAALVPRGDEDPVPISASSEVDGLDVAILDTGALLAPVLA